MTELEKLYAEVKKKVDLPSFVNLDKEFEISDLEETEFFLRKIRRRIIEKFEQFEKFFESLLHPETSFSSMIECKEFSDREMKEIFELYKKIKIIEKKSDLLEVISDIKIEAEFINETYNKWRDLKVKFLPLMQKTKDCWEKEEIKIEFSNYVG